MYFQAALPLYKNQEEAYGVIDKAIEKVQQSGLHHVVCPFETVIEGEYDEVIKLVGDMQQACYDAGATDLLVNMKLKRPISLQLLLHTSNINIY